MMICYVGRRGVGKTAELTKELYNNYHKKGAMVITNYETTFSNIIVKGQQEIVDVIKEVREFKEQGYQPVDLNPNWKSATVAIAIDEAHLIFTSDFWKQNRKDKSLLSTMAEARKMQIHIFLTTQSVAKLDKDIRRYVEPYVFFEPIIGIKYYKALPSISKKGRPMFTRQMRYLIPIFIRKEVELDENTTNHHDGTVLSSTLILAGRWAKKYYEMYDTNELVTHHGNRYNNTEEEFSILNSSNIIKRPTPLLSTKITFKRLLHPLKALVLPLQRLVIKSNPFLLGKNLKTQDSQGGDDHKLPQ